MNPDHLKSLLTKVQEGKVSIEKALKELKSLPFEDIGCANIDHHRHLRQGAPETIFGAGKTVRPNPGHHGKNEREEKQHPGHPPGGGQSSAL